MTGTGTMTPRQFVDALTADGVNATLDNLGGPGYPKVPTGILPSGRRWVVTDHNGLLGDGDGENAPLPVPLMLGFYEADDCGTPRDAVAIIDSLAPDHALRWVRRAWAGGEGTPLTYEEAEAALAPGADTIHTLLALPQGNAPLVLIAEDWPRKQVLHLFRHGIPCRAPDQAPAGHGVMVHLTVEDAAVLVTANADPGRIGAALCAAYAQQDPPLRPLTFRAPEADESEQVYRTNTGEHGTEYGKDHTGRWWCYGPAGRMPCDDPEAGIFSPAGLDLGVARGELVPVRTKTRPGWVNYWLALDAWDATLTREQAALFDERSRPEAIPHGVIGYQALCRGCGEVFGPDLSYADRSGLEHYQRADQRTDCGTPGDVLGWWGAPEGGPERISRDSDWLHCLCDNTPDMDGFQPCLADGAEVEPDADGPWDGKLYLCCSCGRIINQDTLEVVGQVDLPPSARAGRRPASDRADRHPLRLDRPRDRGADLPGLRPDHPRGLRRLRRAALRQLHRPLHQHARLAAPPVGRDRMTWRRSRRPRPTRGSPWSSKRSPAASSAGCPTGGTTSPTSTAGTPRPATRCTARRSTPGSPAASSAGRWPPRKPAATTGGSTATTPPPGRPPTQACPAPTTRPTARTGSGRPTGSPARASPARAPRPLPLRRLPAPPLHHRILKETSPHDSANPGPRCTPRPRRPPKT